MAHAFSEGCVGVNEISKIFIVRVDMALSRGVGK